MGSSIQQTPVAPVEAAWAKVLGAKASAATAIALTAARTIATKQVSFFMATPVASGVQVQHTRLWGCAEDVGGGILGY